MKISELALSDPELLHNEWDGRKIEEHKIGLLKFSVHSYSHIYDYIFSEVETTQVSMIEIGISGGWSLLCWDRYLKNPESKIIGIDPLPQMLAKIENPEEIRGRDSPKEFKTIMRNRMLADVSKKYSDRVFLCYEDAYTEETVSGFPDSSFNIIIDDGSHRPNDKLFVLNHYWSKVRSGGWLIIEDYMSRQDLDILMPTVFSLPQVVERIIYDGITKDKIFHPHSDTQEGIIALRKL